MTTKKQVIAGMGIVALVAALAVTQSLMLTGCGGPGKQQPPAPQVEKPQPVPPPKAAVEQPPAPPPPPMPKVALGPVAPVTHEVLQLMPASAMVALALPPFTGLYEKGVALAKRIVPAGVDVDAEIAESVQQIAQDAGTPNAKSIAEIAKAKGFNPEAPVAVFADLTVTAASAQKAFEGFKAELAAQKAAAAPPKEAAPGQTPPESAPKPEPTARRPKPPDMEKVFSALKVPAIVGVVGCVDPVAAEATVKEILSSAGDYVDPAKVENIPVGTVTVHCYDPEKFAYAIVGNKLLAGNSLALLKEALARTTAPATIRYGTTELPASLTDEVVELVRADKLMPLVKQLLPGLISLNTGSGAEVTSAQLAELNRFLDAYAGEDPIVATLAWTNQKIELLTRVDFAKHPGLAEISGPATPLRLAALLPESTGALLSLRFSDKLKETFKKSWLNALPPEVQKEAGLAQALTYVNQVVEMIGDEFTLGIGGTAGGLPQLLVMAGMAKPDETKNLIQMLAPMTPSEPHEGVDISMLAVPMIPVYIAFPGDTLLLSNDVDKIKEIISLIKAKSVSTLFKSLDPALDPAQPTYMMFLFKSGLLKDLLGLASLAGGAVPTEIQTSLDKATELARELRISKIGKDNLVESRVTIFLK